MPLPDHLQPIEPAAAIHALIDRIATEIPASEYTIELELLAFRETARRTMAADLQTLCGTF